MVKDARRLQLKLGDGIWLRLVDVGEALRRRSYEGDDSVVLEVTDDFCPWNEGRYRAGKRRGADRGRRRAAAVGRRSRVRVPRRVLVRAARGSGQSGGARRRSDRASDGALPDVAAAVLPRAVLVAIKVRTCKTLAEFKQAAGAIAEYGGWDDRGRRRAVPALSTRSTTCMRPSTAGARSAAPAPSRSTSRCRAARSRAPGSPSSASIPRTGGRGSSRR